ncbi:MAG: FAD-dependent oxidoreductase [Psychroflexus sp.]|nr:FAD-dependent oxidoreductase [Psychroflexus sp.]
MLDFLLVGSGIGALCLREKLTEAQKSYKLISDFKPSATHAAGGIINPIILKRFKPFWRATEFYETAVDFYKNLEKKWDNHFISQKEILRSFSSIEEQNDWFIAADQPVLNHFLRNKLISQKKHLKSSYKLGVMKSAYVVDTKLLLKAFHQKLITNNLIYKDFFDFSAVKFHKTYFTYKNLKAKRIIFAEGFQVTKNPFFSYLPIYGNRGDYLIFESKELQLKELIKGREFMIPLGNDLYKFGATFDRHQLVDYTPKSYQQSLVKSLDQLIDVDYNIVKYESGIRPNVKDRRPVLGAHPVHQRMYVMNGFGSRGVFMSPLLSKSLIDYIENKSEIDEQVNINRFVDYFS